MSAPRIVILNLLLALVVAQPAAAEVTLASGPRQVTLIELFTSQGCSSCPPAERWLSRLRESPRLWREVVPLAFHVDYWDYLGWRDTLADPAYSERQRLYRAQGHVDTVYTPGFVVNGREWRNWFRRGALPEVDAAPGRLTVRVADGRVVADFEPNGGRQRPLTLHLALLGADLSQRVDAGENEGRRLVQDFSVLRLTRLRSEEGRWEAPLPAASGDHGRLALAAWVSRDGDLTPLQAVGGWLDPR